jgi:hypothetical protein
MVTKAMVIYSIQIEKLIVILPFKLELGARWFFHHNPGIE